LGSVDGDEVTAAEGDVEEVHAAAVVGADEAESLADDVAAEDEPEESSDGDGSESSAAPEEGLGSVDGDEVTAAQGDVDEVHDAAVVGAGEAESLADDVAAEDEPEESSDGDAPEAGLGSVDGDEVSAAQGDVHEVHDAAVAGEEDAKALSGDTATPAPSTQPATGRTRRRWWQRNRG
jgi:hypothetical protein